MKMSNRELILGIITVTVVLFGLTILLAKPKLDALKEVQDECRNVRNSIKVEKRLVEKKDVWEKRLADVSKLLPSEPANKDMDVHWLAVMDRIAHKHGLKIKKRLAKDEQQNGDVYEMPIECKEWEGSLESLVNFLFELQSEGAMLDIRQLTVKPKGKGVLKGRFILYCAYTREKTK